MITERFQAEQHADLLLVLILADALYVGMRPVGKLLLAVCTIVRGETQFGFSRLPAGKRGQDLEAKLALSATRLLLT